MKTTRERKSKQCKKVDNILKSLKSYLNSSDNQRGTNYNMVIKEGQL